MTAFLDWNAGLGLVVRRGRLSMTVPFVDGTVQMVEIGYEFLHGEPNSGREMVALELVRTDWLEAIRGAAAALPGGEQKRELLRILNRELPSQDASTASTGPEVPSAG